MTSAIEVLPRKIDGDGILGLQVVDPGEDEAKGFLGGGRTLETGPGARRAPPAGAQMWTGGFFLSLPSLHCTRARSGDH